MVGDDLLYLAKIYIFQVVIILEQRTGYLSPLFGEHVSTGPSCSPLSLLGICQASGLAARVVVRAVSQPSTLGVR